MKIVLIIISLFVISCNDKSKDVELAEMKAKLQAVENDKLKAELETKQKYIQDSESERLRLENEKNEKARLEEENKPYNREAANPRKYLTLKYVWHTRTFESDYMEVKLQNDADERSFKNIKYHLEFYNNQGQKVATEYYAWNNTITPRKLVQIDIIPKYNGARSQIKIVLDKFEIVD